MVGFPPQKQLRLQVVHLDGDSQYYPGFRVNGRPLARADLVTSGAYLRSAWGITNLVCEWLQTLARVPGHVRDAGRSRDVGPPASATKLSRRAALSACLLQPQVKLQRVIGAACAAGSAPEPLLVPLLAATGEARQLGERVAAHSVQAPAIIHAPLRNVQFRVGGEGKVCLALVEPPGSSWTEQRGLRGVVCNSGVPHEIPGDWDRASDDMPSPSYHGSDIAI